jgi:hypothetical protein
MHTLERIFTSTMFAYIFGICACLLIFAAFALSMNGLCYLISDLYKSLNTTPMP